MRSQPSRAAMYSGNLEIIYGSDAITHLKRARRAGDTFRYNNLPDDQHETGKCYLFGNAETCRNIHR
jgi:hypothetical protein